LFDSENIEKYTIITIHLAKIDSLNADEFRKEFVQEIEKSGLDILLDFRNVDHIDSSGLSELLGVYRELKKAGRIIKLLNLNSKVQTIIRITELEQVFPHYESLEEATK